MKLEIMLYNVNWLCVSCDVISEMKATAPSVVMVVEVSGGSGECGKNGNSTRNVCSLLVAAE